MKILYAPWRSDYTRALKQFKLDPSDCVFCTKFKETKDDENLIVKRFKTCALVLNAFPYNAGHLMVLPLEHKGELCDMKESVRTELMEVTNLGIEALKTGMKCEGVNVGINLGKAGGGGIPSHLHIHIIPRWSGDTNFLTTGGAETRVISISFQDALEKLRTALSRE